MAIELVESTRQPRATSVDETPASTIAGSALWLLVSNLLYAGCQWGTIVGLAKLGGPAAIGHLGLALAVTTPIVMVTSFGLRAVQATDVALRFAFADYFHLRLGANLLAAVVIAGAVASGVVPPAALAILAPIAAAKIAEATSETCYGLAQRHDRMRYVALSRVGRGVCGLAAMLLVMALGGTVVEGAWAMAAAWTAFLLFVDLTVAGRLEPVFARPRLAAVAQLARESAPIGAVNGLSAAGASVPRYLLQLSHGVTAVGYFTALAAVIPPLSQLAGAVSHAAAPHLGRNAGDRRSYRRLVLQLVGAAGVFGVVLIAGAALWGGPFLALAYQEDFAAYHTTFVVVVIAAALTVVNEIFYFALVAARRPALQLALECFALGTTVVAGLVLIPRFGVPGAAAVTVVSAIARAAPRGTLVLWRRT